MSCFLPDPDFAGEPVLVHMQQVCQRNRVQGFYQAIAHLLPDTSGAASLLERAGYALLVCYALDRQDITFQGADDVAGCRVFRSAREIVASVRSALAGEQAGAPQVDGYLLQVGLGDALPLGYLSKRQGALAEMASKLAHGPQPVQLFG
jgi:hypothetical protein